MKVEQGEKFQPIVITLEDKDEAAALWHVLNKNPYEYDQEYNRKFGLVGDYIRDFEWGLWKGINPLIGEYALKTKGRFDGINTMP
jgi:hypothetical protein